MDRMMDFRMSREGLLKEGDEVTMNESVLDTLSGRVYYYTINPALAMSNNTPERLKRLSGVVTKVADYGSEWTVTVKISSGD
jgi:hypothetical protein